MMGNMANPEIAAPFAAVTTAALPVLLELSQQILKRLYMDNLLAPDNSETNSISAQPFGFCKFHRGC